MNKQILSLILAALMIALVFTGCGKGGEDGQTTGQSAEPSQSEEQSVDDSLPPEETDPAPDSFGDAVYVIKDVQVVDDENCSFTVVGAEIDAFWGFTLNVLCENKTEDKTLTFTLDDVVVNGYMDDPFWSEDVTPGNKSNQDISFSSDMLEKIGSTDVEEISFTLSVSDAEDWFADDLVKLDYTLYPTGLNAGSVRYPERMTTETERVILDDEKVKIIILGVDEDGYFGPVLDCYIENKSDEKLSIYWDNISANGFMVDTFWSQVVAPGARCRADLTVPDDDLSENGVEKIDKVEFEITVSPADDFFADDYLKSVFTYEP